MDSNEVVIVAILAFAVGAVGALKLPNNNLLTAEEVGACAAGQDMTMRETAGQAVYEVLFVDGVAQLPICVSSPTTAAAE